MSSHPMEIPFFSTAAFPKVRETRGHVPLTPELGAGVFLPFFVIISGQDYNIL